MTALLEPEEIRSALQELARRLSEAHIPAGIRVVGGAAVAIAYFAERPATTDVDVFLTRADDVKEVAGALGRERGWPETWLNDKALAYASHYDSAADWTLFLQDGEVTVHVASPELLLAMKLLAGRGQRDGSDIELLLGKCAVSTFADVVAIFDSYYPEDEVKGPARRRVEAWLESRAAD